MDFDQVADELYGLPPPGFTAARNTAAERARDAGEPQLAERIRKLRRPTLGAWLANLLIREHPEETRTLLELAAGLHAAQTHLDGPQLRELTGRRRAVVAALARQARQAAAGAGLPVGEGPLSDLEQTLQAVLSDPQAADAFATGRLTTAQGPTATSAAPKAPAASASPVARAARAAVAPSRPALRTPDSDDQQRQRTAAARRLRAEQQRAVTAAEAAATAARKDLQRATAQRERLQRKVDGLAERLGQARAEERAAAIAERTARTKVEATDREARRARGRAHDAAEHLRHLEHPEHRAA